MTTRVRHFFFPFFIFRQIFQFLSHVLVQPTSRLGPFRRDGRPVLTIPQTQEQVFLSSPYTHTRRTYFFFIHQQQKFCFKRKIKTTSGHFYFRQKKITDGRIVSCVCVSTRKEKKLCWCQVLNNVTSEASSPLLLRVCMCVCICVQ